jgi:hypothetical protein
MIKMPRSSSPRSLSIREKKKKQRPKRIGRDELLRRVDAQSEEMTPLSTVQEELIDCLQRDRVEQVLHWTLDEVLGVGERHLYEVACPGPRWPAVLTDHANDTRDVAPDE